QSPKTGPVLHEIRRSVGTRAIGPNGRADPGARRRTNPSVRLSFVKVRPRAVLGFVRRRVPGSTLPRHARPGLVLAFARAGLTLARGAGFHPGESCRWRSTK